MIDKMGNPVVDSVVKDYTTRTILASRAGCHCHKATMLRIEFMKNRVNTGMIPAENVRRAYRTIGHLKRQL